MAKEKELVRSDLKFPEIIFVSHFDHSTEESPSLNACFKELEAVDDNEITAVAEYRLVKVRKLFRKIEEVPF